MVFGGENLEAPQGGGASGSSVEGSLRKVDVMEIFSPPRVTVQASKFGLKAGEALDLITGYDFGTEADRLRAWEIIEKDKPELVVGSPECTMFSALQILSGWTPTKTRKWSEAKKHLEIICKVYQHQIDKGRWFLHEHPIAASSWQEECVKKVLRNSGVSTTIADQCMYGLRTKGPTGRTSGLTGGAQDHAC